ncbi:polysaccharide export protein [bacterium]|nr:polysaccharide export protein [bacterium]
MRISLDRPGLSRRTGQCIRLVVCLILCSLATPVLTVAAGEPSGSDAYVLGVGDILHITVLDEPDLTGSFQVSSAGNISYPFLGNLPVKGLTVEELDQYLVLKLSQDYLVNPVVTVSVESYQSKKVYVQGEVAKPGVYYLKERTGVLNLLLESGGTTRDASEEIVILRSAGGSHGGSDSASAEDFEQIHINLKELLSGDQSQNVQVQNGDILYVANASGGQFRTEGRFVNIMGEVKKPGNYDYRLGLTVLNAILEAGGFTEYAAKNKVKVIKKVGDKQKVLIARLDDLVKSGSLEEDMLLDPGDLVVVPQSLF